MSQVKPKATRLEGFLDLSDFRLRDARTFEAAKRDAKERPTIARSFWDTHPMQPPWPAYPKEHVAHAGLAAPAKAAHELLQSDAGFVAAALREARARDEEGRVEHRRLVER